MEMENEELVPLLNALVGKTIAAWEFESTSEWGNESAYPGQGIYLHFTDGTTFNVSENMRGGEVVYGFEGRGT
jgi:hypothetical protein